MKKVLFLLFATLGLLSCKTTALMLSPVEKSTIVKDQPNMEFIGCKNVSRSNFMLKNIGEELEYRRLANNAALTYRGLYSEYELATYEAKQRYVTYLEVNTHKYEHNDAVHDNEGLYVAGWVIGGLTVFTLVPVYVPMLCASQKNECEMTLIADYNIVVFDSQTKRNVYIAPVECNVSEILKGQYDDKNTNQIEVNNHYKTLLYNKIVEGYSKAWEYINSL